MSRIAKVYLAILLGGGFLVAAPEMLPQTSRGMSRSDLGLASRVAVTKWDEIERRLENGKGRTGDDQAQLLAGARIHELKREVLLRDVQTASFLALAIASLMFAIAGAPSAVRLRRSAPGGGLVEVMSDETVAILEGALEVEIAKLAPTRRDAILRLEPARHRCAYCGRATRWKILGRIGRRILVKRPPMGAKDLGVRLGEGWWFRAGAPEPCAKCGSKDVAAA